MSQEFEMLNWMPSQYMAQSVLVLGTVNDDNSWYMLYQIKTGAICIHVSRGENGEY